MRSLIRVSTKADYAVRALLELAEAAEGPLKAEQISGLQGIPIKFLENIMTELRDAGLVHTQRGSSGGYWLARPANEVNLAQVLEAVEGPLAASAG